MQRNMLTELQLPKLEFKKQNDVTKNSSSLCYLQQENNVKNSATKPVHCKAQPLSMVSDFAGTFPEPKKHVNEINKQLVFTKRLQSVDSSCKKVNGVVNFNRRTCQLPKATSSLLRSSKASETASKSRRKTTNGNAKIKSFPNTNFSIKIFPINKSNNSTDKKPRNVLLINKDQKKKVQIQLQSTDSRQSSPSSPPQSHPNAQVVRSPERSTSSSLGFEEAEPIPENTGHDCNFTLDEESKPFCVISEVIGNADAAFSGALEDSEVNEKSVQTETIPFQESLLKSNQKVKLDPSFKNNSSGSETTIKNFEIDEGKDSPGHCDLQISEYNATAETSAAEVASRDDKDDVKSDGEGLETEATTSLEGNSCEKNESGFSESFLVRGNLGNDFEIEESIEEESDSDPCSKNDFREELNYLNAAAESEPALITPKKTNDITKIKGWRRKQFLVEKPTTVEFYRIGKGSKQKKIKIKGIEDSAAETKEPSIAENAFTCDRLDEFLDGDVDLKIDYEIPHLYAEFGIKLTSEDIFSKPNFSKKDCEEVENRYRVAVPTKKEVNLDDIDEECLRAVKRPAEEDKKVLKFLKIEKRPRKFLRNSTDMQKFDVNRCSSSSESDFEEDVLEECETSSEELDQSPRDSTFRLESKLLGLAVYPSPYHPLHPLVKVHLEKLRSYSTRIDKNWANFAASAVQVNTTRCKRMILPALCCVRVKNDVVTDNTVVDNTVADDTAADDTEADDLVIDDAVADDTAADDTEADDMVIDDTEADDMVIDEAEANDALANDMVVDDTVANDTVADVALTDVGVADGAVADDMVVDDTVANDTVANDMVANNKVADDTVFDNTVVDDTVANDTLADDTVADDEVVDDSVAENMAAPDQEERPEVAQDCFLEEESAAKKTENAEVTRNGEETLKLKECCVVINKINLVEAPSPWCMEHLTYDCKPCGLLKTKFQSMKELTREQKRSTAEENCSETNQEVSVLPKASFSVEIANLLSKKLRSLKFSKNPILNIDHLKTLVPDNIEFIKLNFIQESYHSAYIRIWYLKQMPPCTRSRAFLTFTESPPMPHAVNLKPDTFSVKNLPKIISDIVSPKKIFSPNEYAILHCNGEVWEIHGSLNIVFGKSDKTVEQVFATLNLPELDELKKSTGKILKVDAVKWWILDLTQEFKLIEMKFGNVTSILSRKKLLEIAANDSLGFIPLRKLSKGRTVGAYVSQTLLPFVLMGPYYLFETHNLTLRSDNSILPFMYSVNKNIRKDAPLKYFINSVVKDAEENSKVLDGLWFYDKMCVDNTSYIEVLTRSLGTSVQRNFPNIDIEHGYSLSSLTNCLPPGVTAEVTKRKDGQEEFKKITVYLYFDIFELGYLEGELQRDNSIIISHPLDRNTKVKSHRMGDWFVKTIKRRIEFIPKDIEVKWFITKHTEDLRGRRPFNKFLLGGAHVLTKNGLFYLLEMSESKIQKLGLEKNEITKAITENQVIQLVLEMKNLANLLTQSADELPTMQKLLKSATEHIKVLETLGESLRKEKTKLTVKKLNLTYTFLKILSSYPMVDKSKLNMVENIEHFFLQDNGDLDEEFMKLLRSSKIGRKYYKRNLKYYRFIKKVRNGSKGEGKS